MSILNIARPRWHHSLRQLTAMGSRLLAVLLVLTAFGCVDRTTFFTPGSEKTLDNPGADDDVVRIALILPISSPRGRVAATAASFRNAAELAYQQDSSRSIELVILDDTGTIGGAASAAEQALSKQVDVIVGPLLAPSVKVVSQRARAAGVPVIAFSTDAGLASPGTFLLSFLPQSEVKRVVEYAANQGRRSFAGLMPNSPYSNVVAGFFQQAVAATSARATTIKKYPISNRKLVPVVKSVAALAKGSNPSVDAIFLPDGGRTLKAAAKELVKNGVNFKKTLIMGTGLWATPSVQSLSVLQNGAIYAAPSGEGWRQFAGAYRSRFGNEPDRKTTLAYDAIGLVLHLVKNYGREAFSTKVITNPKGFSGIDGIFRFLPSGINERALAIHKITPNGTKIIDPAPTSFLSIQN